MGCSGRRELGCLLFVFVFFVFLIEDEDALTWTVVRALQHANRLDLLLPETMRRDARGEPALVMWGASVGGAGSEELARELEDVSKRLGERSRSRTEPDVVIAWPALLVFVEAKLSSPNDRTDSSYAGWATYVDPSAFRADVSTVAEVGLYELARNWRIGIELAADRRWEVVSGQPEWLADFARERGAMVAD